MIDDAGIYISKPPVIRQGWLVTFSDLMALMLTFFVMLFSLSSNDPSKVDSTVSSLTEKFSKSELARSVGIISSQTGIVIRDQAYLDAVISTIRGGDTAGEVKMIQQQDGTLMVRLEREKIFVSRTGVLSPDGLLMIRDLAKAMTRPDASIALPMVEIRVIGNAQEFSESDERNTFESPVIIRQASRFARTLIEADVSPKSISTVILEADTPMIEVAFYAISAPDNGAAAGGK